MTPLVLAIVAVSALLHAAWNVLLKTGGDPLRTSSRLLASSAAVYVPLAAIAWLAVGRPAIPPAAIALGFLSGVLQTAYFILLSAAYRRGGLSVVYPIARGSAPLFAVLAGVAILGEQLGVRGWLGVSALLAGVLVIQQPWARLGRSEGGREARGRGARSRAGRGAGSGDRSAILFALATGVTIASYSAVDRVGARLVAPWLFAAIFFPLSAVMLAGWVRFVAARRSQRAPGPATAPASWPRATATGLISLAAYLLILVAYTMAPLTVVAPLRESAVVLVSGWGSLRLGESTRRADTVARIAAAAFVVLGVALLALD